MEYSRIINGLPVRAEYSDKSVQEIFLPLLSRLSNMQKEKGRRILVMLAAPPAAGKSTLVSFLQELSRQEGFCPVTAIGMDGFHHFQDYLLSHTVELDGETVPMTKVKGAPVSFDLEKLTERIRRLMGEESCTWPHYDRMLHNPVEGAVSIEGDVVLLEGNYLLLDQPGWRELKGFADYSIFISADEKDVRERLITRKAASGLPREEAERHVERSDLRNVRLCLEKRLPADLNLKMLPSGEYVIDL